VSIYQNKIKKIKTKTQQNHNKITTKQQQNKTKTKKSLTLAFDLLCLNMFCFVL